MHDHYVHFYEPGASQLVTNVARRIAGAICEGDVALAFAPAERLTGIHRALETLGIDAREAIKRGRLELVDAYGLLRPIMYGGMPDPQAFDRVIGQRFRDVLSRRHAQRLCAYGELVGILWTEGNETGAVELEQLWKPLLEDLPVSLYCGYPMAGFDEPVWSDTMEAVLALHTHAIPEELTARYA